MFARKMSVWGQLEKQAGRQPIIYLAGVITSLGIALLALGGLALNIWIKSSAGYIIFSGIGVACALLSGIIPLWNLRQKRFYLGLAENGEVKISLHPRLLVALN